NATENVEPAWIPAFPHLEQLEKIQHKIFEEIQQMPHSQEISPVACTMEKKGSGFALTLDTKDFCPEELSVRQVSQEFRRVFDLPQGVNPEVLTCSTADGKLYIQEPVNQPSEAAERIEKLQNSFCPKQT
uniref:SHSP domain-containing protein n=1 Tax=Sinocyclocheilus grahami TaxID=75366 RepID=A0A672NMN3_SINGR